MRCAETKGFRIAFLVMFAAVGGGCIEAPPGAAPPADGGRPLLLELGPEGPLSVAGGCDAGTPAPGWAPESVAVGSRDSGVHFGPAGAGEFDGIAPTVMPVGRGAVVISEIMANPDALSDTEGEWFELHNPGSEPVDLTGCEVAGADGAGSPLRPPPSIAPGGYLSVGRRPTPGFEAGSVASFSLKNTADVVSIRCGGIEVDRLAYDSSFPLAPGASAQLDPRFFGDALNDRPEHWCLSVDSYGSDLGSPGGPNGDCQADPVDGGMLP